MVYRLILAGSNIFHFVAIPPVDFSLYDGLSKPVIYSDCRNQCFLCPLADEICFVFDAASSRYL